MCVGRGVGEVPYSVKLDAPHSGTCCRRTGRRWRRSATKKLSAAGPQIREGACRRWSGIPRVVMRAAFSQDGRTVFTAGIDDTIRWWDQATEGGGPDRYQSCAARPRVRHGRSDAGCGLWKRSTPFRSGHETRISLPDGHVSPSYSWFRGRQGID